MPKVTQQQVHTLITLYLRRYKERYGQEPVRFNRYAHKWGFEAMATDLGLDRSKEVIQYYFETPKSGHPVDYLLYNYHNIDYRMIEREKDRQKRIQLLEESKARVEEWRKQRGD